MGAGRALTNLALLSAGAHGVRLTEEENQAFGSQVSAGTMWDLAPSLNPADFPEHCSAELVQEGCQALDHGATSKSMTSVQEIIDTLASTHASTLRFLDAIGIKVSRTDTKETISCSELCEKTRDSISPTLLPARSDVGCWADDSGKYTCDIDMRDEALEGIKFGERPVDLGHPVDDTQLGNPNQNSFLGMTEEEYMEALLIDMSLKDCQRSVANLFSMYPTLDVTIDKEVEVEEAKEVAAMLAEQQSVVVDADGEPRSLMEDDARGYPPGYDNTPIALPPGYTGGTNLGYGGGGGGGGGVFHPQPPPYSPQPWHDGGGGGGFRPQPSPYHFGGGGGGYGYNPQPSPYHFGGGGGGGGGYNPQPSPYNGGGGRGRGGDKFDYGQEANWQANVQKISVKAQGYVSKAIKDAPRDTMWLHTWMGGTDGTTRRKVMSVLNSVSGMLANVEYRLGPKCSNNTYAYVYPSAGDLTKNTRGQFIFYLCKVYFRSGEGEKIETLTHEGSHHASSFTKDECSMMKDRAGQCVKSYGRPLCKQVASDMPQAAVNNADNYCYYINDLAMHGR